VAETAEIDAWMVRGLCRGASRVDFFPSDSVGVEGDGESAARLDWTCRPDCW